MAKLRLAAEGAPPDKRLVPAVRRASLRSGRRLAGLRHPSGITAP
ncbi:uncharacterized protein SOCE26_018310 [Sorangium cellulosum]|uniref:Uncharacterized protein n=1 Tax=Sorangium cellulosum TaxID=56 RepID=A0A2L0EMB7_SORCE|nr:hypothetical protein [Sorangium cellulosum]AUX40430.1 uncharacterized protein SOCE26_018310 [Sorangium cellulosum]